MDLETSRPDRGNEKHQSDRNQATGRKLQVGQLDSRTGLGCLTCTVSANSNAFSMLLHAQILQRAVAVVNFARGWGLCVPFLLRSMVHANLMPSAMQGARRELSW